MVTEKQIAANCQNAMNNTGPRTEHGKQSPKANAAYFVERKRLPALLNTSLRPHI
jgi:hypothetical protein